MGRLADALRDRMPGVHRFLTRSDKPWPLVREVSLGLAGLLLVVVLLFGLTGQPLVGGYPVVVVTSGSMQHCKNYPGEDTRFGDTCDPTSYGRIGTIDPGDLVFVRNTGDRDDIRTFASGKGSTYGGAGDVIVYRPHFGGTDAHRTPIIHRAMFWLQVEADGTFSIPELGLSHQRDFSDQRIRAVIGDCNMVGAQLGHGSYWVPARSGFITKGDNNSAADQCANGFGDDPATPAMILGKARGEVPWIGLVNLLVGDLTAGNRSENNFGHAGNDSKVMFAIVLVVVVATPYVVRMINKRRAKGDDDP